MSEMVDTRLNEKFDISFLEKAGIEKFEEGMMNQIKSRELEMKELANEMGSESLIERESKSLKREVMEDHLL